jgi:hypothetical protein
MHNIITASAASIPGVNVPQLLQQPNSAAIANQGKSFDQLAVRDHVNRTPTILVGKSGQTPRQVTLTSPADAQSVATALDRSLR